MKAVINWWNKCLLWCQCGANRSGSRSDSDVDTCETWVGIGEVDLEPVSTSMNSVNIVKPYISNNVSRPDLLCYFVSYFAIFRSHFQSRNLSLHSGSKRPKVRNLRTLKHHLLQAEQYLPGVTRDTWCVIPPTAHNVLRPRTAHQVLRPRTAHHVLCTRTAHVFDPSASARSSSEKVHFIVITCFNTLLYRSPQKNFIFHIWREIIIYNF